MDVRINKEQENINASRFITEEKDAGKLSLQEQSRLKEQENVNMLQKSGPEVSKDPLQKPKHLLVPEMKVEKSGAVSQDVLPAFSFRQGGQNRQDTKKEGQTSLNHSRRLTDTAQAVRSSRRTFFDDSWRMKLVKSNIDRLTALHSRKVTENTDFFSLQAMAVDTYRELIRSLEEYLKARSNGKEAEDSRHGKVRSLLDCARTGLSQVSSLDSEDLSRLVSDEEMSFGVMLERDADVRELNTQEMQKREKEALEQAYARKHFAVRNYLDSFPNDPALTQSLRNYLSLQTGYLPHEKEAFEAERKRLVAACETAVNDAVKISRAGAYLERKKVRRDKANQLLSQLRWELSKLNQASFQQRKKGSLLTWDSVWEGDKGILISRDVSKRTIENFHYEDETLSLKDQFYKKITTKVPGGKEEVTGRTLAPEFAGIEGKKSSEGVRGTALMASLLGVPELFSSYKEVTLVVPGQQDAANKEEHIEIEGFSAVGYVAGDEGITLSQALEDARKLNVNLIYSDRALMQLTTIQIMDTICGQVNRDLNSIKVFTETGSREGENYLIIRNVFASNNEYSFGTADFQTVNKTAEESSLKKLWDEKENRLSLDVYDFEFADRILSMDENELRKTFTDAGFSGDTVEALTDRFKGVKQALLADKNDTKSFRYELTSEMTVPNLDQAEKNRLNHKYGSKYSEQVLNGKSTYVNPALLKNYGNVKDLHSDRNYYDGLWNVDEFNKNDDEDLNSVKVRRDYLEKFRALMLEDLNSWKEKTLSKDLRDIMLMIVTYINLDATAEKGAGLDENKTGMDEFLKSMPPWISFKEPFKERLLAMNIKDGLQLLEADIVKSARNMLTDRITTLSQADKQDTAAQLELSQLKRYEGMFASVNGELEEPADIHARESDYKILDNRNNLLLRQNIRDVSDLLLFPHPPCIQDVVQGDLGDCYFLSALASVVENDPSFIQKSMRENPDGTVTVRLYKNSRPFYVNVNKTIVQDDRGQTMYAKGSLWVQMYEKALMISGLMESSLKPKKLEVFKEQKKNGERSYYSIDGGNSYYAFKAITGNSDNGAYIDSDLESQNRFDDAKLDRRVKTQNGMIEYKGDMERNIRETLEKLNKAKRDKRIVTVASRENFIQNIGSSGGMEQEERGLYSTHEYTVLGVVTKNGIPCVRLRNPWGHGRLQAVRNPISGKVSYRKDSDNSYGSFVVDMKTFVTYFTSMFTSGTPQTA